MNKKRTRPLAIMKNGLLDENPTFRLLLGMCPTLAITTAAINGVGMGLAATFVLVGSNVFVSLLRNLYRPKCASRLRVNHPAFVTIVQLVLKALCRLSTVARPVHPAIVVNCIIIARSEAFALQEYGVCVHSSRHRHRHRLYGRTHNDGVDSRDTRQRHHLWRVAVR